MKGHDTDRGEPPHGRRLDDSAPGDLETVRRFWDAALDRFAVFVQANHLSILCGATPPRPPKRAPGRDERG